MSKTEKLNLLFDKWEKENASELEESFKKTINGENVKKDFFERDGIIDEETFEKELRKVLFVSSEANVDGYSPEAKTDYREKYIQYFNELSGCDSWRGKMRERICALYQLISGKQVNKYNELAKSFAVMDLNKRGGKSKIDGGQHIVEYCKVYKKFIIEEINIINPDIIVWIGTNTYNLGIPEKLDAIIKGDKKYFVINGKEVPILKMWQTSYYQARIEPLPNYSNRTIGKLCAKLKEEMDRFGL